MGGGKQRHEGSRIFKRESGRTKLLNNRVPSSSSRPLVVEGPADIASTTLAVSFWTARKPAKLQCSRVRDTPHRSRSKITTAKYPVRSRAQLNGCAAARGKPVGQ